MTTVCIYHGNCQDGYTAAWAVRTALGDVDVEYIPGVYQNPPPDVAGKDVIIVDFSYPRAVLDEMAKTARSILILDHHESAQKALLDLPPPAPTWEEHLEDAAHDPNIICALFDMNRSGAGITWDYFHPGKKRPWAINYIEDRDLGGGIARPSTFTPTRHFSMGLFAYEYNFAVWDELMKDESAQRLHDEGIILDRKHMKDIRELVGVTQATMKIGIYEMPVANLPYTLTSDAGHLMASTSPHGIAACWWMTPAGIAFSLRSIDGGPNCAEVAKLYGGGGHEHAAGFRVPMSTFVEFVR